MRVIQIEKEVRVSLQLLGWANKQKQTNNTLEKSKPRM